MANDLMTQKDDINFFKEAFSHPYNKISMAGFFMMGILYPGFWYLGTALELLYMGLVPTDERYQRHVRAEKNRELLAIDESEPIKFLEYLDTRDGNRLDVVRNVVTQIKKQAASMDRSDQSIVAADLAKLDYLQRTFFRMLSSRALLRNHLKATDESLIKKNLEKLEREIETASPRVKAIKQRNTVILKQRLSRLDKSAEDLEVIDANLDTIEDTLKLIRDNVVSLRNPEGVSMQIDSIMTNIQEGERLMESMNTLASEYDMQLPEAPEKIGA